MRVRAPELTGRGWLNTAGPLSLSDLRGRFVLLDFWTFCCVNCLHVLDELRPLEATYAEELVVVGVHSPKFVHEADPDALVAAVERYGVHHPVLDDPELTTWSAYTARAWPTLVLVDPEGYVVAQYAGEGHVHALDRLLAELVAEHRERGTLQPGDSPYVPPTVEPTDLRFPAKAVPLPDGRVLVADAGHDEVVELASADGARAAPVRAGSPSPTGSACCPRTWPPRSGTTWWSPTPSHHQLRGLTLATGEVRVLAGDGEQWMPGDGPERLSSPWDVAWWRRPGLGGDGRHPPAVDLRPAHRRRRGRWSAPRTRDCSTGRSTRRGSRRPRGLAAAGDRLWLADSEVSALRWVSGGEVRHRGGHRAVRLRVPRRHGRRGAAAAPARGDRAARRLGGRLRHLQRRRTPLRPGDGELDHAGDRARRAERGATSTASTWWWWSRPPTGSPGCRSGASAQAADFSHRTQRPVTDVAASVLLEAVFTPPPGQKVDDRYGPATQLMVTATPAALLRTGEGRSHRPATHPRARPDGRGGRAARRRPRRLLRRRRGEGAACHVHQQDWGVPVRVSAAGEAVLTLPLGGTA